jgi:hypothetical protein
MHTKIFSCKIFEGNSVRIFPKLLFLGLSEQESQYIELKLALSQALAERRKKAN